MFGYGIGNYGKLYVCLKKQQSTEAEVKMQSTFIAGQGNTEYNVKQLELSRKEGKEQFFVRLDTKIQLLTKTEFKAKTRD